MYIHRNATNKSLSPCQFLSRIPRENTYCKSLQRIGVAGGVTIIRGEWTITGIPFLPFRCVVETGRRREGRYKRRTCLDARRTKENRREERRVAQNPDYTINRISADRAEPRIKWNSYAISYIFPQRRWRSDNEYYRRSNDLFYFGKRCSLIRCTVQSPLPWLIQESRTLAVLACLVIVRFAVTAVLINSKGHGGGGKRMGACKKYTIQRS